MTQPKSPEQLADEHVIESPQYSGHTAHVETFLAGHRAASDELAQLRAALSTVQKHAKGWSMALSADLMRFALDEIHATASKALATDAGREVKG